MTYLKQICALLALSVAMFGIAKAETVTIPDADDLDFQKHLQVWLDGDDEAAVRGLVELGNNDNLAAQIFLGEILTQRISGHFLGKLDREDRRSIERMAFDGSPFGQRWQSVASERHPLAKAFLEAGQTGTFEAAFTYLITREERARAGIGLSILYNQGFHDAVVTAAENGFVEPIFEAWVLWSVTGLTFNREQSKVMRERIDKLYPDANISARNEEAREFIMWGRSIPTYQSDGQDGYPENILEDRELYYRLAEYSANDERMAAARFLCQRVCPNSIVNCGIALKAHNRRYERYWDINYSPVEALVSTDHYRSSKRFASDMRRFLLQSRQAPDAVRSIDACYADFLTQKN